MPVTVHGQLFAPGDFEYSKFLDQSIYSDFKLQTGFAIVSLGPISCFATHLSQPIPSSAAPYECCQYGRVDQMLQASAQLECGSKLKAMWPDSVWMMYVCAC